MNELMEKLRKAADWGEDEFDVLSPQDVAAAIDHIEALERELAGAREYKMDEDDLLPLHWRGRIILAGAILPWVILWLLWRAL